MLRAFNQLGPGQPARSAASEFARKTAAAERASVKQVTLATGNTKVARDFVDVRDVARAFVLVIERELVGTFNACSETAMRMRELIDHLAEAASVTVQVERDPDKLRPAEVSVLYGSAARLREATGWRPQIPLEQTLNDLLEGWRRELAQS